MGTVIGFVVEIKIDDKWTLIELESDDDYAAFPGRQFDFGKQMNASLCEAFRTIQGKWWKSFSVYDRNKKGMPITSGIPNAFDEDGRYLVECNFPFWITLDKALLFLRRKTNRHLLDREHFQMYEKLEDIFLKCGVSSEHVRLVGYWC